MILCRCFSWVWNFNFIPNDVQHNLQQYLLYLINQSEVDGLGTHFPTCKHMSEKKEYSRNRLNTATIGQKKLAVSTGWPY